MKTPENFNHNPNVGLTSMPGGKEMYDASVCKYDKASMLATSMPSKSGGKVNKGVLSFETPDVTGNNNAK